MRTNCAVSGRQTTSDDDVYNYTSSPNGTVGTTVVLNLSTIFVVDVKVVLYL